VVSDQCPAGLDWQVLPAQSHPQDFRNQPTRQRQIEATYLQIDKLVYELYGLTKEEIAIVESSVKG